MSIDRLRYFSAVVETGNLRQAAELVGIAPPSMSKAISILETELGHALTYPDGRSIGITPKGLEIYRLSLALLEEHRRFYDRLKAGESRPARIRMGTFEVFSTYFISRFLKSEDIRDFLLLEMAPGKIEQSILSGLVDVGISYLPSPDPALEYREVGSLKMGIFGKKAWEAKEFQDWPFAIPTTELKINSSEIDSLDMWPKSAPKRNIRYQFELLETALQSARQGIAVLHCPHFIVRLQNDYLKSIWQLQTLAPPPGYKAPMPAKVYLVGKKGVTPGGLERKLAKFMRSLMQ